MRKYVPERAVATVACDNTVTIYVVASSSKTGSIYARCEGEIKMMVKRECGPAHEWVHKHRYPHEETEHPLRRVSICKEIHGTSRSVPDSTGSIVQYPFNKIVAF